MKKALILFSAMLLLVGGAMAKPVGVDKARRVAETYLGAKGMKNVTALQNVTAQTPFTEFYVFAAPEGGFILVSADDCVMPVLGYSVTGRFETKDIPEHVRSFLEGYEQEIRYWKRSEVGGIRSKVSSNPVAEQWQLLNDGEMPPAPLTTVVTPLMTTTWGQRPLYNDLCPFDTAADARTVTGCVATATSQIMKYHNHPATGYGSHSYHAQNYSSDYGILTANFGATTYQWSDMPNALTSTSSNTQINAVATLMSHVGIADEMHYDISSRGGSGAHNHNGNASFRASSQTSLMAYFKYRPDMIVFGRGDYPNEEFCSRLRAELDQNRPILFEGDDYEGGHSFVLHGYDNNGLFCVNWGWRGSDDGYYAMGALNPGEGGEGGNATYTFNIDNVALIGIRPNTNWSTTGTTTVSVTTNAAGGNNTISGAGTYSFGDTVQLMATAAEGYRFVGWSDGDRSNPRYLIATGGTYSFTGTFAPMQGDTLGYCNTYCRQLSRYGVQSDNNRWGIKLPASVLPVGHILNAAQLYVGEVGTYTLNVYSGSGSPTTLVASSAAVQIDSAGVNQWHTFSLPTLPPVDGTQNLWITFYCPDANYPASVTMWSGRNEGFCFDNDMTSYNNHNSFMIRALFAEGIDCNAAVTTYPYSEGFEAGLGCWTAVDNNNNGYTWIAVSGDEAFPAHSGNNMAYSFSYYGGTALQADEYLISPQFSLPAGQEISLSWWFRVDGSYPQDKLAVKVSTTGNAVSDFTTTLFDITPNSTHGDWTQQTLDLSAYAGQNIYIAFHHHDSYDADYILLDDIEIATAPACAITSLPWDYGFETDRQCWTLRVADNGSYGFYFEQGSQYAHSGSVCLAGSYNDYFNVDQWAISPAITLPDSVYDIQLSYYVYTNAYAGIPTSYQVRLSTTDTAISSFSQLLESVTDSTRSYVQHTLSLGAYAGQTIRFAFRNITGMGGNTMAFDDIHIGVLDAPTQYTVTVQSNNSSWGTVTGGGTYAEGSTVTLTATANSGYHFVQWNDGNTQNPRTVTVTGNVTYTATFEADAPNPPTGDTCAITTFPYVMDFENGAPCWSLRDNNQNDTTWSLIENYGYNGSSCAYAYYQAQADDWLMSPRVAVAGNYSVSWKVRVMSSYYPETYQVWAMGNDTSIMIFSETLSDTLYQNRIVNFTVPAGDSVLIMWRYVSADMYVLFLDNVTISQASQQQYTITALSADSTMGTVTGGGVYNEGAIATLTAVPNSGYQFSSWQDGNTQNPRSITVTGNATYTATFEEEVINDCVVDVPYFNDFNDDVECWDVYDPDQDANSSGYNRWYLFEQVGVNGTNAFGIANTNSNSQGDYLISPMVTGAGTYVVTWKARTYSPATLYYLVFASGVDTVGTIDSIADTNFNLRSYTFTLDEDDTVSVVFDYITFGGSYLIIDDFSITRNGTPEPTQYTVTAVSNNELWGTVTGGGTYAEGATVTLTATANPGCHFVQWNDGDTNAVRTFTATANVTLVAYFAVDEVTTYTVTVTSNNPVWGTVTGGGEYEEGSQAILTATAYPGCRFLRWNDYDTNAVRTVSVTSNLTFVAIFDTIVIPHYTLTVSSNNPAWGTVTGGGSYEEGTTATLTATANPGCRFLRWHDNDTNATRTVSVTANATYVAIFDTIVIPRHTITVLSNNLAWGTVTGSGEYEEGTVVTLTATANSGYHFVMWNDGDTNAVRTVTVTATAVYTATFAQNGTEVTFYTVSVLCNDPSMGVVSGSGSYAENTTAVLTATAYPGYHFVEWNDGDTNVVRSVTVTGDITYIATFAANAVVTYTLTVLSNNNAWGTVTGSGTYNEGSTAILTATPNPGYHFVEWNDGDTNAVRTVNVTATATYIATFAVDAVVTHTLTVLSSNNAWGTVTGSGTYNEGSTAILTATANPGYHFVEWNDGDTNAVRTVNVTADATYIATFEADAVVTYTLTVLSNNNAWGTVTGGGTYNEGSTAILTATPTVGYRFVQWNDGDTNAVRMVTVTADTSFIATFEAIPAPHYTITVLSSNENKGTVTGSGSYEEGSQVTITATPNQGYRFVQWNDGDTNAIRTITVTANATYIATFDDQVGIEEVSAMDVKLYPNPATDYVVVEGVVAQAQLSLVDAAGRACGTWTATGERTTLDISHLSSGHYFLRIVQNGTESVKKIVVE